MTVVVCFFAVINLQCKAQRPEASSEERAAAQPAAEVRMNSVWIQHILSIQLGELRVYFDHSLGLLEQCKEAWTKVILLSFIWLLLSQSRCVFYDMLTRQLSSVSVLG